MQQISFTHIIKCLLLLLVTTQANAKHSFSNHPITTSDNALIIYNKMNDNEVILVDGDFIEGNLFTDNKYITGRISDIKENSIQVDGKEIKISDIRRIRKKRTQGNRILKIFGLLSLIIGAVFSIIGLSGAVLFIGLIVLGLVVAFQSNYVNMENPDVKTEVKEL